MLCSDMIPGDLESNIWRNNAYKISYIRKERRAKITERRRHGDWMALKGHWMVTEMCLPFSRLNGDWKMTEWRLSVFTEWWRFVFFYVRRCSLIWKGRPFKRKKTTENKTTLSGALRWNYPIHDITSRG